MKRIETRVERVERAARMTRLDQRAERAKNERALAEAETRAIRAMLRWEEAQQLEAEVDARHARERRETREEFDAASLELREASRALEARRAAVRIGVAP